VGLAPSANIGIDCAMFEAVHGSAPDIAGQDIANPSGLLLAGAMMLVHVGQPEVAARVQNAWRKTIEDGVHTPDIYVEGKSVQLVGTQAFADAVIARLDLVPAHLPVIDTVPVAPVQVARAKPVVHRPPEKVLVGVDVFVDYKGPAADLAEAMQAVVLGSYGLQMITNRGVKVWPNGMPETSCTDHWRCRYMASPGKQFNRTMIIDLLRRLAAVGVDFIKTEHLYRFDGEAGFSLGQGQ
jgi:isocitrate dehydrogenase